MLFAMGNMIQALHLMSDSSSELSKAMIEYGRVFRERTRADPTLSTNQVEDNARFRCYSHASNFWGEMSTMQLEVHNTLFEDYQHLNRQVARFFQLHASHDADDKLIGEYDKMLNRVEKVAGFHLPADLEYVKGKVSDARLNPEYRKHSRSKPEYASKPRHAYPPPGTYPVSGFTHGQAPYPLESPAMYPGTFRHRWGELDIKASEIMREASSGDERFKTLLETRDNLMMSSAEKHNDALRTLETDFLTRIAVGLTNTGFNKLKDAYSKADEWASVVGLQTYARQLSLSGFQAVLDEDDESDSDDSTSDDSTRPEDSDPGPDAPGGSSPHPPSGNSGSNSAGGASSGGGSGNSAQGPGSRGNSVDSRSFSSYAGSGSSYEGNQRPFQGLQASLSNQIIYELSDNESPSINSDSPSGSNCDSAPSGSSPNTTQTSLGSTSDLSRSPKGSSSGNHTLAMTQPVPEVAITSASPDTGAAKVTLGKKGGNQKLSGATFGIVDISLGSKTVEGLGPGVAQAQTPFVNPFEGVPTTLSTSLEDPDDDSVDDYQAIPTGRKHQHLRRVPRFIILQGGKLKLFGRHNSYTGTGLKTKSPARDQPLLAGYQRLSSSSLLAVPACDVAAKSAGPLSDPGSSGFTTCGPGNNLFYKNAGGQAAGTIPNKFQ